MYIKKEKKLKTNASAHKVGSISMIRENGSNGTTKVTDRMICETVKYK